MIRCSPGDVVLVRFPFTDLTSAKRRPALVISSNAYFQRFGDVVVLALSSQPQPENELRLQHWLTAGLPKPTWVKPLITTLSAEVVLKRLGVLIEEDRRCAAIAIERLIDAAFRTSL